MKWIVTDQVGKKTLDVIGEAENFNKWMFQTIAPYAKGNVLEIGSGLGNISVFFIKDKINIMLTDLREEYCSTLKDKFGTETNLLGIESLNLTHPEFDKLYRSHLNKYDTVFALNVIEHIENDHLAVNNCKKLLLNKGHLIILVPSYRKLYNKFDQDLGHFRRYTKKSLAKLLVQNDLSILHKQYFNCVGILGWYVSGNLLRKESIPSNQMKLYNHLVPIWKILDKIVLNLIGLSTIVVGQKT